MEISSIDPTLYTVEQRSATIDFATLMQHYRDVQRVRAYCQQCPLFGRMWSCPPHYAVDIEPLFRNFDTAELHATLIKFTPEAIANCQGAAESRASATRAIDATWQQLLPWLYEQERVVPGSRLMAGRCRLCSPTPCTRLHGEPCRHPEQMRQSLESAGFDVVAIASQLLRIELQWSDGNTLQPYITLVTAVLRPA